MDLTLGYLGLNLDSTSSVQTIYLTALCSVPSFIKYRFIGTAKNRTL